MALAVNASGTQTATITTEHDLATPTTSGIYQLSVDVSAMAAGDILELRIKKKVLTGGVVRVAAQTVLYDAQPTDGLIWESDPFTAPFGVTATLKQTAGTGRAFPWSLQTL